MSLEEFSKQASLQLWKSNNFILHGGNDLFIDCKSTCLHQKRLTNGFNKFSSAFHFYKRIFLGNFERVQFWNAPFSKILAVN